MIKCVAGSSSLSRLPEARAETGTGEDAVQDGGGWFCGQEWGGQCEVEAVTGRASFQQTFVDSSADVVGRVAASTDGWIVSRWSSSRGYLLKTMTSQQASAHSSNDVRFRPRPRPRTQPRLAGIYQPWVLSVLCWRYFPSS